LGSPEKPSGSPIETDRLDRVDKIEKIDETDGGNSPADMRAKAVKLIESNREAYLTLMHQAGLDKNADKEAVIACLSLRPNHEWEKHGGKLLGYAIDDTAKRANMDRTSRNDGWKPASPNRRSLLPE
jgi:hypothetical protein